MPTYEYACPDCGNQFERFESIKAEPNRTCPKCNEQKSERRISGGGGFLFKGTGFYVTDYKKSSGGESKPAAAPAATSCCHGGTCSSHSAPAAAPAAASNN